MSESKSTNSGLGFTGALTITFIVLKLCNVVDWSWFWVLSPIWINIGIVIAGMIIIAIYEVRKEDEKPSKPKWQERFEKMKKQQEEANKN